MSELKAFYVSDSGYEWAALCFAETAGKAKLLAMVEYGIDKEYYLDMRTRRVSKYDGMRDQKCLIHSNDDIDDGFDDFYTGIADYGSDEWAWG